MLTIHTTTGLRTLFTSATRITAHTRVLNSRFVPLLALALMAAVAAHWLSIIASPFEVTRARNALLLELGSAQDLEWTPDSPPGTFLAETQRSRYFSGLVEELLGQANRRDGDWERALVLGRHLSKHKIDGEGILSSVENTYRTIIDEGSGYCADYTQVFNGLSFSADIPVREWGMSFDGFAGEGHAFNEVFDRTAGQWIFIDTFYSFFVSDSASGRPLSATEFQEFLLTQRPDHEVELHPIVAEKFGFKSKAKALEYYRRGAAEFYLYLGNNVFSYDAHPAVKIAAPLSRSVEQGIAILFGVHPRILVVRTDGNSRAVDRLLDLRRIILTEVVALLLSGVVLLGFVANSVRRIRKKQH